MRRLLLSALAATMLLACESKPAEDTAVPEPEPAAAPAEPVVTEEIPAELEAEAAKEITAENAEQVAAELEKEIDSE